MKKNLIITSTSLLVLTMFQFCKKSLDVSDSIVGKWKIDSVQLPNRINDQRVYETYSRPTQDYYNITSDSISQIWLGRYFPPVAYKIGSYNGKSFIQFVPLADTILSLTKTNLILNASQGDSKIFFTKIQ